MTLFQVEELTRYWIDHPPPHLMIASYLGIGKQRIGRLAPPRPKASAGRTPDGNVTRFLAECGNAFTTGDVHTGLKPVELDFAELRRKTAASVEQATPRHDLAV